MRTAPSGRWTWSAAAALAVAAVLLGVWWLARPPSVTVVPASGGAGGGSVGSVGAGGADRGVGDGQASIGRDPVIVEGGVRVDSYVVRGDRLLLNYTAGVPACYGEVRVAAVREGGHAVTVTLRYDPPSRPGAVCIDLALAQTVAVELTRPLGDRRVIDGSFRPVLRVTRVARPYEPPASGS